MSKWYLVKYDDNWADEMDVSGHTVISEGLFIKFKNALDKNPTFTFYIGTNEEIEYGEDGDCDCEDAVSWLEISDQDYITLKRLGLDDQGFAERFIECVIKAECGDEYDNYEDEDEADGFYIDHPTDLEEVYFDDFDKAIAFIEEEYGYGGEAWDTMKVSKSFIELATWLDQDASSPCCYVLKNGEIIA